MGLIIIAVAVIIFALIRKSDQKKHVETLTEIYRAGAKSTADTEKKAEESPYGRE